MDIKVNRIDQIKTALNQQNDNFLIHTKAQIYYLKSTDIMCFERNLQISDPDEQVYFYRCMSVEEAWQWVSTWRRDTDVYKRQDMVTVMWANEPFDPEKPDTYYKKV